MISHINDRFNEWARWKLGARSGGSGSPYPAYNLPASREAGDAPPRRDFVPLNDLECFHTDRCVCALCPALRLAVEEFYLRTGTTMEQKAAYCSCSVKTMYRRIDDAHRLVMGFLNDLSCGVVVPAWQAVSVSKIMTLDGVTRKQYISGTLV